MTKANDCQDLGYPFFFFLILRTLFPIKAQIETLYAKHLKIELFQQG